MLAYIILENFKGFKEKTYIDFRKTNYTILPQNVGENDLLKGLAFVGANGSGKSTVLEAVKLLMDLMFSENTIHFSYFKSLLTDRNDFSVEYGFKINEADIIYKISCNFANMSIFERLEKNKQLLFVRDGKDARGYFENGQEKVYDSKLIKPDGFFLRTLYFNGLLVHDESLVAWMDFLKNSKYVSAAPSVGDLQEYSSAHNPFYENDGVQKINAFLEEIGYDQRVFFANSVTGAHYSIDSTEKILFYQRQGLEMPVPFIQESLGNRTLIKVLNAYLPVLENGGLLLIDEFSAGFHSALECVLIKYFMEKSKNSQMVIVSHSVPMLNNSVLRPDQEYAVEFQGSKGIALNRFSNMQPRNSQNISKMYLSGVFGGKPVYEDNFKV